MAQMNPLIGPKLENVTVLIMAREWVGQIKDISNWYYMYELIELIIVVKQSYVEMFK